VPFGDHVEHALEILNTLNAAEGFAANAQAL